MVDVVREAPVGAIVLVVVGTLLYFSTVPASAWMMARKKERSETEEAPSEEYKDVRRRAFLVNGVGIGLMAAGFLWWIVGK